MTDIAAVLKVNTIVAMVCAILSSLEGRYDMIKMTRKLALDKSVVRRLSDKEAHDVKGGMPQTVQQCSVTGCTGCDCGGGNTNTCTVCGNTFYCTWPANTDCCSTETCLNTGCC